MVVVFILFSFFCCSSFVFYTVSIHSAGREIMTGSQTRQNNSRLSIEVVLFTLVFNIPLLFAVIIIVVICYYYYCCCSDGVFVVVDIWCCCCCCFSSRLLRTRAHFSQQCTAARRCARSINRKNQKEIDRFRCTDISICLSFACWACWFASGFAFRIGERNWLLVVAGCLGYVFCPLTLRLGYDLSLFLRYVTLLWVCYDGMLWWWLFCSRSYMHVYNTIQCMYVYNTMRCMWCIQCTEWLIYYSRNECYLAA